MFSQIFLLILTTSTAQLVDRDVHLTEETVGMQDISSLETLQSAMDKSRGTVEPTENVVDTIARLTAELNELKGQVKILANALNEKTDIKRTVAFYAVSDNGLIANLGVNKNVVFETVFINIGNGYNRHHGNFTAPIDGLYMFSSSLIGANGENNALFTAEIIVNDAVYARIYGKGFHPYHDQSFNTMVANLNKGDVVAVNLLCCASSGLYGGRYSTFSGVLLSGGVGGSEN